MANLTARAAAGATSITVDSAAEFPTFPQFEIMVGTERHVVVWLSGTTFTLATGLARLRRVGARVGLITRDTGVAGELVGDLRVTDADGLQLLESGTVQLSSALAIESAWAELFAGGILNSRFTLGPTTDLAVSQVGTGSTVADYEASVNGSDLPGWVVSQSAGTLLRADSTAFGSPSYLRSTASSNGQVNEVYQDVPVVAPENMAMFLEAEFFTDLGAGSGQIEVIGQWRRADHSTAEGTGNATYTFNENLTANPEPRRWTCSNEHVGAAPYLRITVRFTHTTSTVVLGLTSLRLSRAYEWAQNYLPLRVVFQPWVPDTGPLVKYLNADTDRLQINGVTAAFDSVISDSFSTSRNDYAPTGGAAAFMWRLTNSSGGGLPITGISTSQVQGQMHLLVNVGTQNINLLHEDTGSATANRFSLDGTTFSILPGVAVLVIYDGVSDRWRFVGTQAPTI